MNDVSLFLGLHMASSFDMFQQHQWPVEPWPIDGEILGRLSQNWITLKLAYSKESNKAMEAMAHFTDFVFS